LSQLENEIRKNNVTINCPYCGGTGKISLKENHKLYTELLSQRKSPKYIAEKLGVTRQTLYNWKKELKKNWFSPHIIFLYI
jgi:DNA invertase Pin-like site-specific DNA recombinase